MRTTIEQLSGEVPRVGHLSVCVSFLLLFFPFFPLTVHHLATFLCLCYNFIPLNSPFSHGVPFFPFAASHTLYALYLLPHPLAVQLLFPLFFSSISSFHCHILLILRFLRLLFTYFMFSFLSLVYATLFFSPSVVSLCILLLTLVWKRKQS